MKKEYFKTYKRFIKSLKRYIKANRLHKPSLCNELKNFIAWTNYLSKTEKSIFMEYALDDWSIYAKDIIEENYLYVPHTEMVRNEYIAWKASLI